jgi:hypothetical protein
MKNKTNHGTTKNIERLITKWRSILGIDPVYIIQYIEATDDNGHPAWIDGLTIDNPHPTANIFINADWLERHKHNEKKITELIIHELLHALLFDPFLILDPNYKYEGNKARVNEALVMKLTSAFIKVMSDK